MKLGVILVILGVLGIGTYIYWQLTPLALNYSFEIVPDPEYGKFGLYHIETIITRDWTLGIAGGIIGLALAIVGIVRCAKAKNKAKTVTGIPFTGRRINA